MSEPRFTLEHRGTQLINTDPQRRCYNGCHAKSELVWEEWEIFTRNLTAEKGEKQLKFWRDLNAYAVEARGKSAASEYRLVPYEEASQ